MKCINFVILLIAFSCVNIYSQYVPFPLDSIGWKIDLKCWSNGESFPCGSDYILMNGDTVINNKVYKKLDYYTYTYLGYYGFLREESKVISFIPNQEFSSYSYYDTSEYILYDFNLEVGDTFYLGLSELYSTVYDIDSVQLNNGEWRRRILLTEVTSYICYLMEWVEGAGNLNGHPFYNNVISCLDHFPNFSCYHVNQDTLYGDCTPTVSSNEVKEIQKLKLYPNPVHQELIIDNDLQLGKLRYSIYSNSGKKIIDNELMTNRINTDKLSLGVYFLQIYGDEFVYYSKFIKI